MSAFGLLNINKPAGPTSHDIVAGVRRGTRVKKVGHAGTLDPMATGVLVVCLGAATRLSQYAMGSRKTYLARVRFGIETDTYDAGGIITAENDAPLGREAIEAALRELIAILADPEHHEMTTIVAVASDMQRKYPLCNVITVPCANDSRPAGQ